MQEHDDGYVSGSIDRARVAELYAATDDENLKAHYREVLGESDEGKALDEPAEAEAEPEQSAEDVQAEYDQLVIEAEAAGVKIDGRWGVDRLREEIAAAQGSEE